MIPPQELGKKAFNRAVRGYEPSEVDDYVDLLLGKYADIYKQCEIYDKKLKIVAQKIAEIQEREDEIQSREETISKTMMSSQKIHDRTIEEAQGIADNIIAQAEETAEKILADARERAQRAMTAVNKKTEAQVESAREKSESLFLAARTRSAKLLGDLKKEINGQKERLSALKYASETFNAELSDAYRKQVDAIKGLAVYAPAIDFERLTETRLFNIIMEEIKEDMAEIEAKNGEAEYEFEKELMLLRDFAFADEHIKEYKAGISGSLDNYNLNKEENGGDDGSEAVTAGDIYGAENVYEEDDEDMKVFAGSVVSGEPEAYESGAAAVEEEPIATYDSDDYQEVNYSYDSGDALDYDEDSADENIYDGGEENAPGIFKLFKGFGKKKKPDKVKWSENIDEADDIDNIYNDLDDDDEEKDNKILDMFDGLGEDEEED